MESAQSRRGDGDTPRLRRPCFRNSNRLPVERSPATRGGHDPEALEGHLSVFEARAEESLWSILDAGPPWNDTDRYNLVTFTALQYVRGWHFRKQFDELGTLAMRREMLADRPRLERSASKFLQERRQAADAEAVAEFIDSAFGEGGPRLVLEKPHAIQISFQFALDVLAPMLWERRLRLMRFAPEAPLLTSDSPVVTWAPGRAGDRVVGLRDAASITLPVGRHLAIAFVRGGEDAISTAGATRARQVNLAAADLADRWIFHHPEDSLVADLNIPAQRPRWLDERVAARIDEDGNYRELWRTIQG